MTQQQRASMTIYNTRCGIKKYTNHIKLYYITISTCIKVRRCILGKLLPFARYQCFQIFTLKMYYKVKWWEMRDLRHCITNISLYTSKTRAFSPSSYCFPELQIDIFPEILQARKYRSRLRRTTFAIGPLDGK